MKKKKNLPKRTKIFIGFLVLIILLIVLVFGARIWLFLNLILGNDVVLRLSCEKTNFDLKNSESAVVAFKASVTTNPFCSAGCNYSFEDISSGSIMDSESFILIPSMPFKKEYQLTAPSKGEGQLIYRFSMSCLSKETFFCRTKEELNSRKVLVTVKHSLDDSQADLKDSLRPELESIKAALEALKSDQDFAFSSALGLDPYVPVTSYIQALRQINQSIFSYEDELKSASALWNDGNYSALEPIASSLSEKIKEDSVSTIQDQIVSTIVLHNSFLGSLKNASKSIVSAGNSFVSDKSIAAAFSQDVSEFNSVVSFFKSRADISRKKVAVDYLIGRISNTVSVINDSNKNKSIIKSIENWLNSALLCSLNVSCINTSLGAVSLDSACRDRSLIASEFNSSLIDASGFSREDILSEVSAGMPGDYNDAKELVLAGINGSPSELPAWFIDPFPLDCKKQFLNLTSMANISIAPISIDSRNDFVLGIGFPEAKPVCCVFGSCRECCMDSSCIKHPVIFIHGFDFNKDTPAEYGLEIFNRIQANLESDGWLDAGHVSVYPPGQEANGFLGLSGVPLSFRASYYLDLFKDKQSYSFVQTKRENLETYAVRLKEIVDDVAFITGSSKVVIIAHSMGCLVARRYLQLFGDGNVATLIMIAAPNHGISGSVIDYCNLLGGKSECRDLESSSLFINKLNREPIPQMPIVNIIGTGCKMDSSFGDGIALKDSAFLEGAENHIINGSCTALGLLHTKILNPKMYPEVYSIINQSVSNAD